MIPRILQKENFLDVADSETAILELANEADALDGIRAVHAVLAAGPNGFFEEAGALVEPDGISRHTTARCNVSDPQTFIHTPMLHLDDYPRSSEACLRQSMNSVLFVAQEEPCDDQYGVC